MVDSVTAIEVVTKGIDILGIGILLVLGVWLYCKVKELIFGDE